MNKPGEMVEYVNQEDINADTLMKTIKDLPEYSRPREKLREKGAAALTDEELVAAILGMGTAGCAKGGYVNLITDTAYSCPVVPKR